MHVVLCCPKKVTDSPCNYIDSNVRTALFECGKPTIIVIVRLIIIIIIIIIMAAVIIKLTRRIVAAEEYEDMNKKELLSAIARLEKV